MSEVKTTKAAETDGVADMNLDGVRETKESKDGKEAKASSSSSLSSSLSLDDAALVGELKLTSKVGGLMGLSYVCTKVNAICAGTQGFCRGKKERLHLQSHQDQLGTGFVVLVLCCGRHQLDPLQMPWPLRCPCLA